MSPALPLVTTVSERGAIFTDGNEGFASLAYRCPAGVITIGNGFTNRSEVFRDYWIKKHGHELRMGDTIERGESRIMLRRVLNTEYAPYVAKNIGRLVQHEFDGATDMTFNCGPKATTWKWAKALATGLVDKAAKLLEVTGITANGRKLQGLINRRMRTSRLIRTGDYGNMPRTGTSAPSVSSTKDEVAEYQRQLKKLGYYTGEIDGIRGPATKRAVRDFQRATGLLVDGIVGPATRATLIRELDKKTQNNSATGAGGIGAGGAGADSLVNHSTSGPDIGTLITWGVGIVVLVALVYFGFQLWRYRGVLTGQRVPT